MHVYIITLVSVHMLVSVLDSQMSALTGHELVSSRKALTQAESSARKRSVRVLWHKSIANYTAWQCMHIYFGFLEEKQER